HGSLRLVLRLRSLAAGPLATHQPPGGPQCMPVAPTGRPSWPGARAGLGGGREGIPRGDLGPVGHHPGRPVQRKRTYQLASPAVSGHELAVGDAAFDDPDLVAGAGVADVLDLAAVLIRPEVGDVVELGGVGAL